MYSQNNPVLLEECSILSGSLIAVLKINCLMLSQLNVFINNIHREFVLYELLLFALHDLMRT
jgi:hypothetical protein